MWRPYLGVGRLLQVVFTGDVAVQMDEAKEVEAQGWGQTTQHPGQHTTVISNIPRSQAGLVTISQVFLIRQGFSDAGFPHNLAFILP